MSKEIKNNKEWGLVKVSRLNLPVRRKIKTSIGGHQMKLKWRKGIIGDKLYKANYTDDIDN